VLSGNSGVLRGGFVPFEAFLFLALSLSSTLFLFLLLHRFFFFQLASTGTDWMSVLLGHFWIYMERQRPQFTHGINICLKWFPLYTHLTFEKGQKTCDYILMHLRLWWRLQGKAKKEHSVIIYSWHFFCGIQRNVFWNLFCFLVQSFGCVNYCALGFELCLQIIFKFDLNLV